VTDSSSIQGAIATSDRRYGRREQTAEAEVGTELTVVLPCLNEADTLATCIRKAKRAMREDEISGEVVVADNGSTDGSREIAQAEGARVVTVSERGYGNALMGGIAAARGRYVLMGDADDSYDFLELPRFVRKLREGYDVVQGCRLPRGGGRVLPGRCRFSTSAWAIHCSRRWLDPGFERPSTTSTAVCGPSPRSTMSASASNARAWSSRPR
jgi:glycosyltransferase involved in cell wall biosynthesis